MGHARLKAIETRHDAAPLVAMRLDPLAILEVMHQPMGHLVGNHVDEEGLAILAEQDRIEAQATAAEMCLPRTFATNVQPHPGPGEFGIHLASQFPGSIDTLIGTSMQR